MFYINGRKWRVLIVSPSHPALIKDDGQSALGMCYDDNSSIYISSKIEDNDFMFKKVLCHEVVHAAMFSYNVDLNNDEEELIAELIATYGQEIINVTNEIFYNIQILGNYY